MSHISYCKLIAYEHSFAIAEFLWTYISQQSVYWECQLISSFSWSTHFSFAQIYVPTCVHSPTFAATSYNTLLTSIKSSILSQNTSTCSWPTCYLYFLYMVPPHFPKQKTHLPRERLMLPVAASTASAATLPALVPLLPTPLPRPVPRPVPRPMPRAKAPPTPTPTPTPGRSFTVLFRDNDITIVNGIFSDIDITPIEI